MQINAHCMFTIYIVLYSQQRNMIQHIMLRNQNSSQMTVNRQQHNSQDRGPCVHPLFQYTSPAHQHLWSYRTHLLNTTQRSIFIATNAQIKNMGESGLAVSPQMFPALVLKQNLSGKVACFYGPNAIVTILSLSHTETNICYCHV